MYTYIVVFFHRALNLAVKLNDFCLFFSISAGTLGFYLNGVAYPNGSTVLRTDIGEGNSGLQCTTDNHYCCYYYDGQFYMPDGSIVLLLGNTTNGYYKAWGSWHILLNRRFPGTITGQFQCNILQASWKYVDLYINIGE